MTVSWDLRPLVLDGVLGDKCSHIYGTHPQRTLPPCLIWLGTCILSHAGNSAASLSTFTLSGSCALVSQFERLLSNFTFLEKRDPRPAGGKIIASTGLQKGGAYPCEEEGSVAEAEWVGGDSWGQGRGMRGEVWAPISGLALSAKSGFSQIQSSSLLLPHFLLNTVWAEVTRDQRRQRRPRVGKVAPCPC